MNINISRIFRYATIAACMQLSVSAAAQQVSGNEVPPVRRASEVLPVKKIQCGRGNHSGSQADGQFGGLTSNGISTPVKNGEVSSRRREAIVQVG